MNTKKQKIKVLSSFTFDTQILRAEEIDGNLYLIGCASSDSIDAFETVFSQQCQEGFIEDCANKIIQIDLFHDRRFIYQIGKVVEAYTQYDEEKNKTSFYVKIMLKKNNIFAVQTYNDIKDTDRSFGELPKIALSISGDVIDSHYEVIDKKLIKVFDRVELNKIAITDNPANPDTFLQAIERSLDNSNIASSNKDQLNINKEVQRSMQDNLVTASEVLNKVNTIVAEMVNQVNNIQKADLTTANIFGVIKMFVEDYENKVKWTCFDGLYAEDDLSETETEIRENLTEVEKENEVIRSIINNKNNLLEMIETKSKEIESIEREASSSQENTQVKQNDNNSVETEKKENETNVSDEQTEQSESSESSNNSSTDNLRSEGQNDSNQQQVSVEVVSTNKVASTIEVASTNKAELEVEPTVAPDASVEVVESTIPEEVVVTETLTEVVAVREKPVEVEVKETVSREMIQSEVKSLVEEITREYLENSKLLNTKLEDLTKSYEEVNRELEVLRNAPTSDPVNTAILNQVTQQVKSPLEVLRENVNSSNRDVRQKAIDEAMQRFAGKQ